jgi:O-methyltransferase domain
VLIAIGITGKGGFILEMRIGGPGESTRPLRSHSGDFFVSVPAGGDTYVLSRVIHHWNDEKAVAI